MAHVPREEVCVEREHTVRELLRVGRVLERADAIGQRLRQIHRRAVTRVAVEHTEKRRVRVLLTQTQPNSVLVLTFAYPHTTHTARSHAPLTAAGGQRDMLA